MVIIKVLQSKNIYIFICNKNIIKSLNGISLQDQTSFGQMLMTPVDWTEKISIFGQLSTSKSWAKNFPLKERSPLKIVANINHQPVHKWIASPHTSCHRQHVVNHGPS